MDYNQSAKNPSSSSPISQRCSASNPVVTGGTLTVVMDEDAEQPPDSRPQKVEHVHSDDDNDSMSSSSSYDEVKASSEEEVCVSPVKSEGSLISCALPRFETPPAFSYLNPKVAIRKSITGVGLFASFPLRKDEVVLSWSGKIVHLSEVYTMRESERTYILQIDEELFQIPPWKGYNEPADFTNHSCNPNCGFKHSPSTLVAMRDIAPGEEIAFDYAMCESINGLKGNEFNCCCSTNYCRGSFTGNDWRRPELWDRYGDYFSPYLREKIKEYRLTKNL